MCQIMKIGQIVVLCDLSDAQLTVSAQWPSPRAVEFSVCSKRYSKHILSYIWAIVSQNNNVRVI